MDDIPIMRSRPAMLHLLEDRREDIAEIFEMLQTELHASAALRGLYDGTEHKKPDGEKIALMHADLSKAVLAICGDNPADEHLPEHDVLTVKLADLIIRVLDYAEWRQLPLADALVSKAQFNLTR